MTNILIIGAGDAGRIILQEYQRRRRSDLIVGFLDDDPSKIGMKILGVTVLGSIDSIAQHIGDFSVTHIIVAMPSVKKSIIKKIVSQVLAADSSVNVYVVPEAEKFFDSVPISPSLVESDFAEIFERDEYTINIDLIEEHYRNKTILITGAGGSIGSELCKQLLKFNVKKLVCVGRGEHSIYTLKKTINEYLDLMECKPEIICRITDVKDQFLLSKIFEETKPDIVFHSAAHKHVPLMEYNEIEAIQNNVIGTRNVLHCSYENEISEFVLISTDKAVRPTNIMGATKRVAELLTSYYHDHYGLNTAIVRFGNVVGSRGSVFHLFKEQIEKGGPVTVTHPEITRFFMSISEAALLVINAVALSSGGEVFVLNMKEQFKIYDMAQKMIELYGYAAKQDVDIVITELRPGEKMHEELFYNHNNVITTQNDKIFIVQNEKEWYDESSLLAFIEKFPIVKHELSSTDIRYMIKKIVPEYEFSIDEHNATIDEMRFVN